MFDGHGDSATISLYGVTEASLASNEQVQGQILVGAPALFVQQLGQFPAKEQTRVQIADEAPGSSL